MKNFLLLLLFLPILSFSQEAEEQATKNDTISNEKPYDQWSIELNVGMNRTDGNYAPGYFQVDENDLAFGGIAHFDLGVRYMFNEKFGLKFSGAYDIIENYSDKSLPFDNNLLRFNLEGVANLRNYLDFDSWTKRFGLLAHAGVHYSFFGNGNANDNLFETDDAFIGGADEVAGFIIGFTPQYRLSHTFVLTLDASFIQNYRHHQTWDFTRANPNDTNLNADFMTFSLGITAYLGKKDMHADWYVDNRVEEMEDELARLNKKIDELDSRVTAIPIFNPVPFRNEIQTYVTNYVDDSLENFDVVERLIRDEYFRIYFDFDIDMPNDQSHDDVSTLINFMKQNPEQRIEIIGLTDVLGSDAYNDSEPRGLSQRRAKNVHDILVAAGIDSSRMVHRGGGKNPEYTSKNEYIRKLARTAIVKLIN